MTSKIGKSLTEFFETLREMRGSQPLDLKLVNVLDEVQGELSEDAKKVLLVYFSLLRDGNTCISLRPERLLEKWAVKWNGLVTQAKTKSEFAGTEAFPVAEDFSSIFANGCGNLLELAVKPLGENIRGFEKIPMRVEIVEGEPFLFADKYWKAKETIREIFGGESDNAVFKAKRKVSDAEKKNCKEAVKAILSKKNPQFDLKDAQAEAILCGQDGNLIVTGGPGTGKTTVVQFLLWNLFEKNPAMRNWSLYFVAPSGKAANRLNDIRDLEDISDEAKKAHPEIVKKFGNVEGKTLHRLLNFNPSTNAFSFNPENRLPERSIFVVDEASMIDIVLFAAFLGALPEKDYRLFVLGDGNQLPSVEAGAVLGEVLGLRSDAVVELVESNRFLDDSAIGRFAKAIQEKDSSGLEKAIDECGGIRLWDSANVQWPASVDSVNFVKLAESETDLRKVEREEALEKILKSWSAAFCENLPKLASAVRPSEENAERGSAEYVSRKNLWTAAESARILSAERRDILGVESINRKICANVRSSLSNKKFEFGHFPGQILMFTRNQTAFGLFNGDSGVVVKDSSDVDYLMVKSGDEYPCFPLSLFPGEALSTAFAITIHKSQGSGYGNILMFLPFHEGHPLLNRQILYTGVTRVKMGTRIPGSLTLVSSMERLREARRTLVVRDTGIWMDG